MNNSFPSDVYDHDHDDAGVAPPVSFAPADAGPRKLKVDTTGDLDLGDVVLAIMFAKPSPGVGKVDDANDVLVLSPSRAHSSGIPCFRVVNPSTAHVISQVSMFFPK